MIIIPVGVTRRSLGGALTRKPKSSEMGGDHMKAHPEPQ